MVDTETPDDTMVDGGWFLGRRACPLRQNFFRPKSDTPIVARPHNNDSNASTTVEGETAIPWHHVAFAVPDVTLSSPSRSLREANAAALVCESC